MLVCERVGVKRFIIETPRSRRDQVLESLGEFGAGHDVMLVESFGALLANPNGIEPGARCLAINGNIVLSKSQLNKIVSLHGANPDCVLRFPSTDSDHGGEIAAGPFAQLVSAPEQPTAHVDPGFSLLPFALNGRPEDRDEAELRLARSLKEETEQKDAWLAKLLDRNLSWRISYRLARTAISPNQVTIVNTLLGLACGWMFSIPDYWWRLAAAVLFVVSITIDGIDGELARLQMSETEFGGRLDLVTDNIVHVAIFLGIYVGCYREAGDARLFYLAVLFLLGFGATVIVVHRALSVSGEHTEQWLRRVEQMSGRDFAYLLLLFALFNRLEYFAWGTAIGVWIFAAVLATLTWWRQRTVSVSAT